MSRVMRLLEQWLPLWACLSGAIVPASQEFDAGVPDTKASAALGAQLDDILKCVALQEQAWPSRTRRQELPGP